MGGLVGVGVGVGVVIIRYKANLSSAELGWTSQLELSLAIFFSIWELRKCVNFSKMSEFQILFSLVQVKNQSFGPKQNSKFTVDHRHHPKLFSLSWYLDFFKAKKLIPPPLPAVGIKLNPIPKGWGGA